MKESVHISSISAEVRSMLRKNMRKHPSNHGFICWLALVVVEKKGKRKKLICKGVMKKGYVTVEVILAHGNFYATCLLAFSQ